MKNLDMMEQTQPLQIWKGILIMLTDTRNSKMHIKRRLGRTGWKIVLNFESKEERWLMY